MIKQKIHVQTEKIQTNKFLTEPTPKFVDFLPDNEIHELGILFLNFLILSKGFQTIFLGQSIPTNSLKTLLTQNSKLHFVTYLTIKPSKVDILKFANSFNEYLLKGSENKLSIFGPQTKSILSKNLPDNVFIYSHHEAFIEEFLNEPVFI